jgi:hypothetical protein
MRWPIQRKFATRKAKPCRDHASSKIHVDLEFQPWSSTLSEPTFLAWPIRAFAVTAMAPKRKVADEAGTGPQKRSRRGMSIPPRDVDGQC